jgi:TfoX/Sxy family transcriptional regulator of competence genes
VAYDEGLAQPVRDQLQIRDGVAEKKMLGGLCFLLNGNMCCGVVRDTLMVRVGPEAYDEALAQLHATEMDFTGRPLRGMVYIEPPGIDEDGAPREWLDRGVVFAEKLQPN